jgi:putative FmdB family regulatory protein
MPIYDYHCRGCNAEFEQLVRGEQAVSCPHCAGHDLDRLMSLPARPPTSSGPADYSRLGPPSGGCCGGACQSHSH